MTSRRGRAASLRPARPRLRARPLRPDRKESRGLAAVKREPSTRLEMLRDRPRAHGRAPASGEGQAGSRASRRGEQLFSFL